MSGAPDIFTMSETDLLVLKDECEAVGDWAEVEEIDTELENRHRLNGLATPRGYTGVEWADGTVHAISLDDLHDDRALWRETPVCGRAGPGVSSDEGGPAALHRRVITCLDCAGILG
jgi:hypothetical protein